MNTWLYLLVQAPKFSWNKQESQTELVNERLAWNKTIFRCRSRQIYKRQQLNAGQDAILLCASDSLPLLHNCVIFVPCRSLSSICRHLFKSGRKNLNESTKNLLLKPPPNTKYDAIKDDYGGKLDSKIGAQVFLHASHFLEPISKRLLLPNQILVIFHPGIPCRPRTRGSVRFQSPFCFVKTNSNFKAKGSWF